MQLINIAFLLLIVYQNDAHRIKREHFEGDNKNHQRIKTEILHNASESSKLHETAGVPNKTIGLEERHFQETHDEVKGRKTDISKTFFSVGELEKEAATRKPHLVKNIPHHHKNEEKHCPIKQKHVKEYFLSNKDEGVHTNSFSRGMHPSIRKFQFVVKYEPKIPIYPMNFVRPSEEFFLDNNALENEQLDFNDSFETLPPRMLSVANPTVDVENFPSFFDKIFPKKFEGENNEVEGECQIHNKNNNGDGVMQVCSCRFYKKHQD